MLTVQSRHMHTDLSELLTIMRLEGSYEDSSR